MCVCSLSFPACNAQAPYCYLWPVWLYRIFPLYLINRTILENKFIAYQLSVLIFWNISVQHLCGTFLFLTQTQEIFNKCTYVGIYGAYQLCEILIKLDSIDRFWRNTQILNFTTIRPVSPVISCRRMDGHDDANRRFSQFSDRT